MVGCRNQHERSPGSGDTQRVILKAWISTFVLLTACCSPASQLVAQDKNDDAVEQYLSELGLADLQIRQLNDMINLAPTKRTERAKRLVDLYINELIKDSDDEQRRSRMLTDIKQLLAKVPGARTAGLEVMLSVVNQQKAETYAERWLNGKLVPDSTAPPLGEAARQEAVKILRAAIPQLEQHKRSLEADLDKLDKQIGLLGPGKVVQDKLKEERQKEVLVDRAIFFLGFSHYYAGVTSPNGGASFQEARKMFREFLRLEPANLIAKETAETLGLNISLNALALMVLAQCEMLLKDFGKADACFNLLKDPSVRDADRMQAIFRQGRTLMVAKQFPRALNFMQDVTRQQSLTNDQQRRLYCFMVKSGVAHPQIADAEKMIHVGLREIATLGDYNVVQHLVKKFEIKLDTLGGFYFSWIKGRMLLAEAEKTKTKAAYLAALEPLQAALRDPGAKQDQASASTCRYQLACCQYFLQDYEASARLFELAGSGLKEANDKNAVNAVWNAIASYLKTFKKNPRSAAKIVALLKSFKADYPRDARAGKVDFLINQIERDSLSRMDAVAKLEKIPPGDKTYVTARYDVCTLLHEQWGLDRSKKDVAVAVGKQLAAAIDTYLKVSGQKPSEERLKCCLWALEVHLSTASENLTAARRHLDLAENISKGLPAASQVEAGKTPSSHVLTIYYQGLRLAQKTKNAGDAEAKARWLVRNARGHNYEIQAVVHLCKVLEKEANKNAEQRREAYELYARLATHYGQTENDLRTKKNAKYVNLQLAHYAHETGAFGEAADVLTIFLSLDPKNEKYLRRLGLANFEAKRYPQALGQWRTLVSGLKRGSQQWHEARYYQIASLAKTDRSKASKVYKQFEVFYPSPPSPWKRKYFELGL